jgi:hypothetical protein
VIYIYIYIYIEMFFFNWYQMDVYCKCLFSVCTINVRTPRLAGTVSQLRIAIREVAHMWSRMIYEMAMQIHVLQRVVAKKEDPVTHEKFIHVLHRIARDARDAAAGSQGAAASTAGAAASSALGASASAAGGAAASGASVTSSLLAQGQLLELFWHRLSSALQDVAMDKVRHHPLASSRAYPYIRRAAVDILHNLRGWTDSELGRDFGGGSTQFLAGQSPVVPWMRDASSRGGGGAGSGGVSDADFEDAYGTDDEDDDDDDEDEVAAAGQGAVAGSGMFGSLAWSQEDLLGTLGGLKSSSGAAVSTSSTRCAGRGASLSRRTGTSRNTSTGTSSANDRNNRSSSGRWRASGASRAAASASASTSAASASDSQASQQQHRGESENSVVQAAASQSQGQGQGQGGGGKTDHSLVLGLKPMRDKFLLVALSRMSAPIAQMFPELEGYTGK